MLDRSSTLVKKGVFFFAFIMLTTTISAQIPANDNPCITGTNPPIDLSGGGFHEGTTCEATFDFDNVECSAQTQDASVWYTYTPTQDEEGYNILLEPSNTDGPFSIEYYSGNEDAGCSGDLTLLGSGCNVDFIEIKLGNCFDTGEILYIKVTSDDAEDQCGFFFISITLASCDGSSTPSFANEPCETANFDPLEPITPSDFSFDYLCVTGCLDYACPQDDALGGCTEFIEAPTVWFQVTTDELAAQMYVTVEAIGNWDPIFTIYSGTSCEELTIFNFGGTPSCSDGDETPELHQIGVFDDISNYWIAVSYDPASIPSTGLDNGSFELCVVTTVNSLILCIGEENGDCTDPSLVMEVTDREFDDQSLDGPFYPGEEVTINIEFDYNASESGADWLMGFVPIFGEGWDLSNFDYNTNAPIGNGTTAQWYTEGSANAPIIKESNPLLCTFVNENGDLTLCNQLCNPCTECPESGLNPGDPLPSGYFWVTNGENPGCDNDGSPGEGWGIGSTQASVSWSFTLTVKEPTTFEDCIEMTDLSILFQTFSHGTVGCWEDPNGECILDRMMFSPPWEIECEGPPAVFGENQEICHNGMVNIEVATVDGSTTQIQVDVNENPNVDGEMSHTFDGGFGVIDDNLLNFTNEVQIVIYEIYAVDPLYPNIGQIHEIEVTVYPDLDVLFPPVFVCEGDCANITPDIFGGTGGPYTYEWINGETTASIEICPIIPTTYTVTVTDILGCQNVGELEVDIKPFVDVQLPKSIIVCKDDNFDPFNPDYVVCLDFISGSSPIAVQWITEPGLIGQPFGISSECFAINEVLSSALLGSSPGVYTLTVNITDFFGCLGTAEMEIIISGELALAIDVVPYECGDTETTINVTGIDQAGNPISSILLYGGCPDKGLGDFLEEVINENGTIEYPLDLLNYTCYTIIGLTNAGCQSSIQIEVPIAEGIDIDLDFDANICAGSTAIITVKNENDYESIEWFPAIGDSGMVSFVPDSTMTYTVTGTSSTGCHSSELITITVHPVESIYCTDPCFEQEEEFLIVGTAFSDDNSNGVFDPGEVPLNNVLISDNSTGFIVFTNILGQYVIPTQPGSTNSLTAIVTAGQWIDSTLQLNDIIVMDDCTEGVDFGFTPVSSPPDAQITVTNSITRCDFETKFYVTVENKNQESISGQVVFNFDDKTDFFSSDISGSQIVGNQLTFPTGIILPFSQNIFIFKLKMPGGSAFLPMLDFEAQFLINNEIVDQYSYSEQLRCSYDPNDKRTHPDREGDKNPTLIGETIDYTIRFQNNGNDTAFNVQIVDVLDSYVDTTSIRFNSSSHPFYACLMNDTLVLDFVNIRLVDSMTNYPGSQGFVNFSLNIDKTVPEGTVITNTADIIFDSNEPIVTNTVINTMVYDFCSDPITDLSAQICNGEDYLGYTETGNYQDTIITEEGCDSILNIDLIVITAENINLEYTICEGETIVYDGSTYTFDQSGQYNIEIDDSSGCVEQVLLFNVNMIPIQYLDEELVTICMGEDFEGLDTSGIYTIQELDPNTNCPKIRTVNLTVIPQEETNLQYSICEGEVIEYGENEYTFEETGNYTIDIEGEAGCIVEKLFFEVDVIPTIYLDQEDVTICEDEDFEGLDSTGIYSIELLDPDTNCPLIRTINLTVLPLTDEACTVSTNSITAENIRIFPNPTSDKLSIRSDYTITSLNLYTTTGNSIYKTNSTSVNNAEVDLSSFPSGLYLLKVETEKGRWIEKVIRR